MKFLLSLILSLSASVTMALPYVSFSSVDQEVGERYRDVSVSVVLSEVSSDVVRVPFVVLGSATFPTDHDLQDGAFLIAPGNLTGEITFRVELDDELEGEEDIIIKLMASQNAMLGDITEHQVRLYDRAIDLPILSFEQRLTESDEGVKVEVVAKLDRITDNAVVAQYVTSGSAEVGVDHNLVDDVFVINPGELETILSIDIYDDGIEEGEEYLDITILSPVNNAILGEIISHRIIINDPYVEPPPPPVISGSSCADVLINNPGVATGKYLIDVDGDGPLEGVELDCDMTFDGGGWTLVSSISIPQTHSLATEVFPGSNTALNDQIYQRLVSNGVSDGLMFIAGGHRFLARKDVYFAGNEICHDVSKTLVLEQMPVPSTNVTHAMFDDRHKSQCANYTTLNGAAYFSSGNNLLVKVVNDNMSVWGNSISDWYLPGSHAWGMPSTYANVWLR